MPKALIIAFFVTQAIFNYGVELKLETVRSKTSNFDSDLIIEAPSQGGGPIPYPKEGQDFDVTIKILEKYEQEMSQSDSAQFQKKRQQIQSAVLELYVDDKFYQDTILLELKNGSINARMLMRFTKNGDNHLGPLSAQLLTSTLGELPVSQFFVSAKKADYEELSSFICRGMCSEKRACSSSSGCHPKCCMMMIPTRQMAMIQLPKLTPPVSSPIKIAASSFNDFTIPSYQIPQSANVLQQSNPFDIPSSGLGQLYPSFQQPLGPPSIPEMDLSLDVSAYTCPMGCPSYCSPYCSETCCASFKRSSLNRY